MPQGSTAEAVDISFFLLWKVGSEVPDSRSKLIGWPAECERIAGFAAIVLPGFRPFVSGPVHVSPLGPNPQIDNIGAPSARRALERPNRRGRRYRRLRNHCQRARPSGHLRCPYRGAYRHGKRHRQGPRNRWLRRLAGPASRNRDSACLAISGHRTYRRRGSPSRGNRELRSSARRASVGVEGYAVLRLCPILLRIQMREGMQVSAAPVIECDRSARILEEPCSRHARVIALRSVRNRRHDGAIPPERNRVSAAREAPAHLAAQHVANRRRQRKRRKSSCRYSGNSSDRTPVCPGTLIADVHRSAIGAVHSHAENDVIWRSPGNLRHGVLRKLIIRESGSCVHRDERSAGSGVRNLVADDAQTSRRSCVRSPVRPESAIRAIERIVRRVHVAAHFAIPAYVRNRTRSRSRKDATLRACAASGSHGNARAADLGRCHLRWAAVLTKIYAITDWIPARQRSSGYCNRVVSSCGGDGSRRCGRNALQSPDKHRNDYRGPRGIWQSSARAHGNRRLCRYKTADKKTMWIIYK